MSVDQNLYLSSDDIGKKVEAFDKYLECTDTVNCEGYNAKDNGSDIVSWAKEYSELKGTTEIGTIQREDENDDDSLLEVA